MSRTFQDENFLVWEAFPSGGNFGFDDDVRIVFHCVTDRRVRPRFVETDDDSADAARIILKAAPAELLDMLRRSHEIG
ncbi:MAG TPA: hypothetical protein VFU06_14330 [Longimicrobiales bacterium]|nr:hypothetical protein [Longimicrobiales bacterium]